MSSTDPFAALRECAERSEVRERTRRIRELTEAKQTLTGRLNAVDHELQRLHRHSGGAS